MARTPQTSTSGFVSGTRPPVTWFQRARAVWLSFPSSTSMTNWLGWKDFPSTVNPPSR